MLRVLLIPLLLVVMLLKGLLWVLFVPLGRGLLKLANAVGPLRLPFVILFSPIIVPCILLDRGSGGRLLEGDLIRPTFTLPYAFARGPWEVLPEQGVRSAELELVEGEKRSTLSISVGGPLSQVRANDEAAARLIDRSSSEPALPNGMRWAGMRMTVFLPDAPLTCFYLVWSEADPERGVINVKFTGAPEHEAAADAFVHSVLPELPEPDGDDEDDVEPAEAA